MAGSDPRLTSMALPRGSRHSTEFAGAERGDVRPRFLRAPCAADVDVVERLAGSLNIARTMISIPHPLPRPFSENFVSANTGLRFGICGANDGLVGTIELRDIEWEHRQAEMSFWVGRPFWNRGYAVEAGSVMLRYAFDELNLNRVYAYHMVSNPASGRVLDKLGMRREGLLRQRVLKDGCFQDVVLWAVLNEDLRPTAGGPVKP